MGSPRVSRGAGLLMLLIVAGSLRAEPSQSPTPTASQPAAIPARQVFGSDSGLVLNFIKTDKTADFEAIVAKLGRALRTSVKPERAQQAASWKVFRAAEPAKNGATLYIFLMDPAVKDADYTVSTILAEGFPDEVQALYKQYADSYATGQIPINLKLVEALGNATPVTK